ncbi:MAG: EamA family transporter [Crocinitomicaceae bacterium]|nr:EamA family transporter [Crocinitomicaceae bacterium]|tara:strand:- start:502 stop:1407 length:906 start_codon:yes stop_codon:yes gene_type:complete
MIWGVLILLAFIWGSSFILMKIALFDSSGDPVYSAMDVAALRINIAAIALLPIAIYQFKNVDREKWVWILGVGTFGNLLPAYLFASAQTELPSAIAGMLNSLTPLFTMIIAVLLFKTSISRSQLIGLVIGFIGAMLLISDGGNFADVFIGETGISIFGCGKIALATLFYGLSVNILKNKLLEVGAKTIASIALAMVMPFAFFALINSDIPTILLENPSGLKSMLAVVVLAVIGTAAALAIFNALIKWTDALTASSVTYIIPVFAAMWGFLDGEELTVWHFIGGMVILFGVALVKRSGSGKK